jgi:hypothetical protein
MAIGYGSGCSGSAGLLELQVDSLPWIGGEFRATVTGLPTQSLAIGIGGFYPMAIPLAAILPAGASCFLWTSPDALYLLVPAAGQAPAVVSMPQSPLYIGKAFSFQAVALEFGATGSILDATSSAAVALVVGSF